MDDLRTQELNIDTGARPSGPYIRSVLEQVRRTRVPAPKVNHSYVDADIGQCCHAMVNSAPKEAKLFFQRLCKRGLTVDKLFEDVFARISVRLGDMWCEDDISFMDVTLAYANLQMVLHEYRAEYVGPPTQTPKARLLFATLPKETHVFGLLLLTARLEKMGYATLALAAATNEQLVAHIETGKFDAVGLSCGGRICVPHLNSALTALSAAKSQKPVLIGGILTLLHTSDETDHKVDLWSSSFAELTAFLDTNIALQFENA